MMKKPFEPDGSFVKVSRSLYTLYTQLPDFNPDHLAMYIYLCDMYNSAYGYAFPTQAQISERLGIGLNKPRRLANVLKKYELIDFKRLRDGANYVYYIKAPIEDPDKFYKKYPDVPRIKTEEEPPEDILSWL